jgi:opacity protein-like surface antigen
LGYEFSKKDTVLDPGEGILDETNTAFAYQVIVGVAAPLGRRFHFNADYRYWRALEVDMTTDAGDPISTEHEMQVVSLGLRYDFTPREVEKYQPAPTSSGGYTEVQLGWLQAEDSDIDDGLIDTNFDAFAVHSGGSVTAGYAWDFQSGRRVRAELGLTYWTNDADIIEFGPLLGEFRSRGSVDTLALSGNLFYEPAASGVLRPYVGIGAGYAEVDYNVTLLDSGGESQYVDDSDSGFATQVLLGVSTRLSSRFEASLNYRYWWIPTIELENPAGGTLKTEHSAHGLMLGLRYLFQ